VEGPRSSRQPTRLPARDAWQLGPPDLIVTMPEPYELGGDGADVFRTFVVPVPASRARYVKALEFRASGTSAVHHANIKIDPSRASRRLDEDDPGVGFNGGSGRDARFPDGHFLGWTPGQSPQMLGDSAWRLPPDSDLVIEAHMLPTGKRERVQVSVGLYFTDTPPARVPYMLRLGSQRIDIPPGEARYESTDAYVLPVSVNVLRVQPHAHHLARRIEGTARLPDGRVEPLIRIEDWDFRWQDVYEYAKPLPLPAGTTLMMRYTYDNSPENPRNPNRPPRRVTFGQTTASEMGDLWLQVVTRSAADRAALDRDFAPKMLEEDIAGVEKALEGTPSDAHLRIDLGLCYLAAGRIENATIQLQEAVRLEPRSASAHYELGTLWLQLKRYDEARSRFASAISLKPGFAEAHNNLGVVSFSQGRIDDAVRSYREAIRSRPNHAEAHFNLGRALVATERRDEALTHFRQALNGLPDDAAVHTSIGSLLAAAGQTTDAIAHYRRALAADQDLPAALTDLAWILATTELSELRAPGEAVRLAERAAALTQDRDATVLDTLAAAYFADGRVESAVSTARAALQMAIDKSEPELASRIRQRLAFYEQHRQAATPRQ
jgi:tetratricopeptide (TPR) repeat protein